MTNGDIFIVTLGDIREAQSRLQVGVATRTRLLPSHVHEDAGAQRQPPIPTLKPENQQPIGSFKLRGAYNKVASLSERVSGAAVSSTYSSGNHASRASPYAARALGVKAVIVNMPGSAPAVKREATQALGAEIIQG